MEKTVVITGGAKGIGADISSAFYKAGYRVLICGREDNGFAGTLGERARFVTVDVRRPEALRKLADIAVKETGALDVWINNAGYSAWRALASIDESFWDDMLDTNLKGVMFGCQAAAGKMISGGCIINISSLAGKRGSANNSAYCASKFGINGITQALAKELGPVNIRVNALCPVFVRTEGLMDALHEQYAPPGGSDVDAFLKSFTSAQSALMRLPTGEEVGQAALFLASDQASAITGQCINVDCGVLPQ